MPSKSKRHSSALSRAARSGGELYRFQNLLQRWPMGSADDDPRSVFEAKTVAVTVSANFADGFDAYQRGAVGLRKDPLE